VLIPLIPHIQRRQAQLTLQLSCYAMFGLRLLASILVITVVWSAS
jgi:hypothetical protein